ncbi:MAG TPA: M1 family metallopeptidase [Gammaproteobacteria bacterium]|nr:M1 family metallopeptidase [Gammaproteobacteria bacterium]
MRLPLTVMLFAACTALAACSSSAEPSQEQAAQADPQSSAVTNESIPTGRLPDDVQPLAYSLDFTMDPDKAAFTGHEEIQVKLTEPRDTIWLHGVDIDVQKAKLVLADGQSLDINYKQVNDDGVVKLSLPKTVSPQKVSLVFDFKNEYSPGLLGAYKVKENGDNYIFTQFEAIAARRAFPSFDEPGVKTPFTYSFTVPKSDKVVANTPVTNKTNAGNGMVKWEFESTRPLPTYLVAWAVGPLDIVKGPVIPPNEVRDHPVPVYGVTIKGKGNLIHYAIEHADEIIEAEEKYYGIGYPFSKIALIAVPDFAAGAMENPGAVTFRGRLLLFDPDNAPTWQKRAYWSVTAHELGHMWTGDLVTVPWWNDIWLNEAFATWQEQKVMKTLHPDWQPKMDILQTRQYAMRADSLVSARAIRQPIKDTGDIKTAFDGITYLKGAAVISMFENFVGPEKFQQGMHDYLKQNAYGSANLSDFLSAISKAAGQDVGSAFKTFLNQPGLPLVEMTLKMKDGKPTMHLVQSRYLPLGSAGDTEGKHWDIPVCVRYPADGQATQQCYMLSEHSADVALKGDDLPEWFMPNAMGNGYYQWSLGHTGYQQLTQSLDQLTPVGQMSLAGSIEAAFHAGKIDTAEAMQALAPLAHSKHEEVAEEPMDLIGFAHEWLTDGKAKNGVEAYARKLYSGYDVAGDFEKGGAPEDPNRSAFESHVASFLAHTGQDQKVREAATAGGLSVLGMSDGGKADFNAMAPDFIPVALRVAVREKGEPVFDKLNKLFNEAPNPFVRSATLEAMASVTEPKLAEQIRNMALNPEAIKRNEIATVLFNQFSQPETRDASWQWTKKHYDKLVSRLPGNFGGRLPRVAAMFCSEDKAAEIKAFFQGTLKEHPGSERTLTQALESAHLCAAQRKAQSDSAEKFFSQF